jgi:Asp-tRNA(Asn)/Glu-tRNA(Gln) amidotransferase A subunit family amidase
VRRAFAAAVERIEQAGAEVVWDCPGLASSVRVWATIACADARWAEAEAYEYRRDRLGEHTAAFLEFGDAVTSDQYVRAQAARDGIHQAYADMFARTGAEVLLTPALGCEAFPHGSTHPAAIGGVEIVPPWLDWAGFLYDANLAGLPALALPIGFGDAHLPVSMQLLGPRMSDGRVLAIAEAVERLLGRMPAPPEPAALTAAA